MAQPRVLVADDDDKIRELLELYLTKEGFAVEQAADGAEAILKAQQLKPDLIVLDIMMPVLDGMEVCRQVRKFSQVPVIMLTARTEDEDRIMGLELGADDYLAKPFQMGELVARVRGVVRRGAGKLSPTVVAGRLRLDTVRMTATFDGAPVRISPLEFRLLDHLAHQAGRAVSAGELAEHLYGVDGSGDANAIEAIVARLRRKFGNDLIRTRRGFGYLLEGE